MYYTYIVVNSNGSEYQVGVTTNIQRRKKILCSLDPGCKLVYYEEFEKSEKATERENILLELPKPLIKELIDETNPMWINLE